MNTTKTFTAKSKKEDLINLIVGTLPKIDEKSLRERINYTMKQFAGDPNKVPKDVLVTLANDIQSAIGEQVLAPIEASAKPKLSVVKDKSDKKTDTKDTKETKAKEEKKTLSSKTKAEKKEAKVETASGLTKTELPMAKIFPQTIEHDVFGPLTACPDKYKTMKEVREALENNTVGLVFAGYWTKRHIKEFSYATMYDVPVPKDGFPNDLDTMQVIYACDGVPRIYALSTTTEAMFRFDEVDLQRVECESPDGTEKFTMRYSAGLEYEIYEYDVAEGEE